MNENLSRYIERARTIYRQVLDDGWSVVRERLSGTTDWNDWPETRPTRIGNWR